MANPIIMRPLPTGAIPVGTLVWGSDFNAASALLYRWFGVLEAPAELDLSAFYADLFYDDCSVDLPQIRAVSLAALKARVAEIRGDGVRAHHLGCDDIRLSWSAPDRFRLTAACSMQHRDVAGATATRQVAVVADVARRADGRLLFTRLAGDAGPVRHDVDFVPSYAMNRARSAIIAFQAEMDALSGEASGARELLMPILELHGLVASKKDQTQAGGVDLTDVNTLRKQIAGADHVPENLIRDFDGFAAWVASTTGLFNYGLHRLERVEVTPLPDHRFEVIAQFDWQAETANGARIELHQPLTWIFVDTDERFMRIEKLLPFG